LEPVIRVEHLSKSYVLKHKDTAAYSTFREALAGKTRSIIRGSENKDASKQTFWALEDLTFDINAGDRVGIIGRNGAGKSTLLKILSRIVTPTHGRITLEGRVASLLEVGTGFHPELSGRENIFLNGAILGMSKEEIKRKFSEIVEFAEVGPFLDTPVKRYSSGMYVKLAFSVAAHLDPEILIVDEVLAVGDAAFQKKCLNRMREVAGEGRTILFVSHNMAAIQNLCDSCIYLKNGRLVEQGATDSVVSTYLRASSGSSLVKLEDRKDRSGSGDLRFISFSLIGQNGDTISSAQCGKPLTLRVECMVTKSLVNVAVSVGIDDDFGQRITHFSNEVSNQVFGTVNPGKHTIDIHIPRLPLKSGDYTFTLYSAVNSEVADWLQDAGSFFIESGDFFHTGKLPPEGQGNFFIDHSFSIL
jgi:lipopolysaccharide transport system ATP-binding protein